MIYFLNKNFSRQLTGIEHAALGRFRLFKKYNTPAKIVIANFNTELFYIMRHNFGVLKKEYSTLYDFFQESECTEDLGRVTLQRLFSTDEYRIKRVPNIEENDYRVYYNDTFVMYVHCFSGEEERIAYINYFDINGKKIKRVLYDWRGFISSVRILGDDQKVILETFYTPTGRIAVQKFFGKYSGDEKESQNPTRITVLYKGVEHFFVNTHEFLAFYLDCLTKNEDRSILIADKNIIFAEPMFLMKNTVEKYSILHSVHVQSIGDVKNSPINRHYRSVFKHSDTLTGIIVLTEWQKEDILGRFSTLPPLHVIPSGYANLYTTTLQRKNNKILLVARISEEKQIDHAIIAFSKVKKSLCDAELYIYGFEDGANKKLGTGEKLKALVEELNLSESIFFMGYSSDLSEVYATSELFLFTSKAEGFGLVLLEAAAHGVPAVAYNIRYGASSIIVDKKSGFLVEPDNIDDLADKMLAILESSDIKKQFIANSFEQASTFSENAVMALWKKTLRI